MNSPTLPNDETSDRPVLGSPLTNSEIHSLLGEFLVEFQFFCFSVRSGISMMVENQGSTVASILTTDMTARPLLSAFTSIAHEIHSLNDFQKLVISKTYNRAIPLIERRNQILHAIWFPISASGMSDATSTIVGSHSKHSKKGINFTPMITEASEFRELIAECEAITGLTFQIATCLMLDMEFEHCFIVNDGGSISLA